MRWALCLLMAAQVALAAGGDQKFFAIGEFQLESGAAWSTIWASTSGSARTARAS